MRTIAAVWLIWLALVFWVFVVWFTLYSGHQVLAGEWVTLGILLALVIQWTACKLTGKLPTQLRDIGRPRNF